MLKHESVTKFGNKAWSTHSFRHTVITGLIEKAGIEKTSVFIGHKSILTTQLYDKSKNSTQLINKLAALI